MNQRKASVIRGAGLGLRRAFIGPLCEHKSTGPCGDFMAGIDFMEVAPENWINVGGRFGKQFRALTEVCPFVLHGLSLSLGSPAPLDLDLVRNIKRLMDSHGIDLYTEHLSYCSDEGHLYDLMPIPFTDEAVHYVAKRIRQVQDILERRIGIENVSYYAAPGQQMREIDFLNAVLDEADCDLLLDVNNIYVNSVNHQYDALEFLRAIPARRIAYLHVAGHFNEADDLIVDTHGAAVVDPVWQLLDQTYALFGAKPTLLERDFNIPPLPELVGEVEKIRAIQSRHQGVLNTAEVGAEKIA
ncbi:MAG: DUF692 domain-containing protein [Gammaproteobacteria bacterium]|nr:DUF692 domain-containing protein [Gammaproteobacteria bacterium]